MRSQALALVALGVALPAAAEDGIALSGTLGIASDRIDRGLSLSGEDPSGSAELFLDHANSGLFGGLVLARTDDPVGNDLLLEGTLGIARPIGAWNLDLSGRVTSLQGEDSFAFPEVSARLWRDFGLFYTAAGVSWAPDGRWFVRDRNTVYSYVETEVPIPRLPWLAATGHVGLEAIDGAKDKVDWGIGLAAGWKSLELTLGYEDSDSGARIGNARAVAALRFHF